MCKQSQDPFLFVKEVDWETSFALTDQYVYVRFPSFACNMIKNQGLLLFPVAHSPFLSRFAKLFKFEVASIVLFFSRTCN